MPRFSIIIPFHNNAATLADTLDSLRDQTFRDWEVICVDDRSTDDSAAIISDVAVRDTRIKLTRGIGQGPSNARNLGAAIATGDILAFCDADDLWTHVKLDTLARVFQDTSVAAAFGQIGFFNAHPADCRTLSTVPQGRVDLHDLLAENPVCTMSNLAVRRDVFDMLGGLNPDIIHNEDLEFLIRLVGEGHGLQGVDELHTWYRTSPTGLSSDLAAMQAGRARALQTAARYGAAPDAAAEAVYMRYLARRSLRLDCPKAEAWQYAIHGLRLDARGFLFPLRRGVPTAVASALATLMPSTLRRSLFCH